MEAIGGVLVPIQFGVSGSTILSDLDKLIELFWDGISDIEIGEFVRNSFSPFAPRPLNG